VKERRPKVAILGFTDHKDQAPFGDSEFEIWGINELYRYMNIDEKTFHRWFEIHDRATLDPDEKHIEALKKFPVPVYMQTHYDDIGPSVKYPRTEVEQACDSDYFTSTPAWMLGLAIAEGFKEIHVYGVDMAQDSEYKEQRPACEHLLGIAKGKGIKIYVPPTSDLLKSIGQYGFGVEGSVFHAKLKERIAWLTKETEGYQANLQNLENEYQQKKGSVESQYQNKKNELTTGLRNVEGALQDCNYWLRSWAVSNASGDGSGQPNPDRSSDPRVTAKPLEEQKAG
jgi:hypothetical protein